MRTCLIWGMGKQFRVAINSIRLQELMGNIKIVGVTSESIDVFDSFLGYPYYDREEIGTLVFDVVIVCKELGCEFSKVREWLNENHSVPFENVVSYHAFEIPTFSLDSYIDLQKKPVTIFSNNCWGTFTYNSLHLPFDSPFINLFLMHDHYLRFLRDPKGYLGEPVKFVSNSFSPQMQHDYAVGAIGDVEIHFLHYATFEEAVEAWEKRKQRINWDNLLVEMACPHRDLILEFAKLPYEKKICFAPFSVDEECVLDVGFLGRGKANGGWKRNPNPFAGSIFTMARGQYLYYDPLELVHSGKIRLLSEPNGKLI